MKLKRHLLSVSLVTAFLLVSSMTTAQISTQTLVNYAEVTDEDNGVSVNLYFNILDNSGLAVTQPSVRTATIVLDDGNRYDADVERPDTPFYITLVLDASGSMGGASTQMQQAAIQLINNAPQEAHFNVIRFNQQVDVLVEGFTRDRNRAINAVGEVNPVNLSGTCLYDAVHRAIELSASAPTGRRAIILFTDGRDETALPGTVCSTHTYDEVINLASQANSRVPIYTIGYRGGQEINETELRNFASATGGVSAIGSQQTGIVNLFERISQAIDSQWVASAVVFPQQGVRTATLLVTLNDGSFPQPAVATFDVSRTHQAQIPLSMQATVQYQVSLALDIFEFQPGSSSIQVRLQTENVSQISEYQFDVKNASNNLLVGEFVFSSPLPSIVDIPVGNLADGEYLLQASAVQQDGRILGQSDNTLFVVVNPTATPTSTPLPVGAVLSSIEYNTASNSFTLYIDLLETQQLGNLQINLVNASTNLQERRLNFNPATTIEFPVDDLSAGDYEIVVNAQDLSGQTVSRSTRTISYQPNTPTPTITPTATATPVEARVRIDAVGEAETLDEFIVRVTIENTELISSYQISLTDNRTGLQVAEFDVTPTNGAIRVPLLGLTTGEYSLTLRGIDEHNRLIAEHTVRVGVSATEIPVPTPTAGPTEVPTTVSVLSAENLQRNAAVIVPIILAIIIVIVILVWFMLRKPKQEHSDVNFYESITGPQPVSFGNLGKSSFSEFDAGATSPELIHNPDLTSPILQLLLPRTKIVVEGSRDPNMIDKMVEIKKSPFTVGRKGSDLDFNDDSNVSRRHAEISYVNSTFYIKDLGSTHGSIVNGTQLTRGVEVQLENEARIVLGTTTKLRFETETSTFDPDVTNRVSE